MLNSITTPIHIRSRHLYRHLLRQTHILHDDICRTHISRILRKRFETPVVDVNQRAHRLKRGNRFLSLLQRANAGAYDPLLKVLKLGYGRLGPRWHELMKPVIAVKADTTPKPPLVPGKLRTTPPTMTEPLVVLLNWSQVGPLTPKTIPEKNTWLLPLQASLKANKLWRHYTNLVSECAAPLPEHEWTRLEGYAMGTMKPNPPPQRKRENVEEMRRKLVEVFDRRIEENIGHVYVSRPREMGERSWKRMWREVMRGCPKLVFDEEAKGRQWRAVTSGLFMDKLGNIKTADESLFEGYVEVDAKTIQKNQRRLREEQERAPRKEGDQEKRIEGFRERGKEDGRDKRMDEGRKQEGDRGKRIEGGREKREARGQERRKDGERERNHGEREKRKEGDQVRRREGLPDKVIDRTPERRLDQGQPESQTKEEKEVWLSDKAREIKEMLVRMHDPPSKKPMTKDAGKQTGEKRWSVGVPEKKFPIDRKRDSKDGGDRDRRPRK